MEMEKELNELKELFGKDVERFNARLKKLCADYPDRKSEIATFMRSMIGQSIVETDRVIEKANEWLRLNEAKKIYGKDMEVVR
jgi:DNA-binding ferritin-like protein (Dps family)